MTQLTEVRFGLSTGKDQKLARFARRTLREGVLEVIKDGNFVDSGVVDSLDLVSLAVYMEKQFGRKIGLTSPATLAAWFYEDQRILIRTDLMGS